MTHSSNQNSTTSTDPNLPENSFPTILCIDDDPDITRSMELIFSNYEVNVISACCGSLGIWEVYEKDPAIIITDLGMPHGDGQSLLQQVKSNSQTAHIPVIVFTGKRDAQLQGRLRNLGAAGCLQKPVHRDVLLEEVRRFITFNERDWSA